MHPLKITLAEYASILFIFFLTGFAGLVFYLIGEKSLLRIKVPGLFFALGSLGGTICFHLIPEYLDKQDNLWYLTLVIPGFFLWFIPSLFQRKREENTPSIIALVAGDALHNASTSILWMSLCLASGHLELMVLPAILLHEVPHKVGNFAIMIFSGLSKKIALLLSLTASLFFFAGLIVYQTQVEIDAKFFIPIIVGSLSYTFFSGIRHERESLKKPSSWLWLAAGIFLMIFVNLLSEGQH